MLTFYINRAGKSLPKTQRDRLERAKGELKRQFGRGVSKSARSDHGSSYPRRRVSSTRRPQMSRDVPAYWIVRFRGR